MEDLQHEKRNHLSSIIPVFSRHTLHQSLNHLGMKFVFFSKKSLLRSMLCVNPAQSAMTICQRLVQLHKKKIIAIRGLLGALSFPAFHIKNQKKSNNNTVRSSHDAKISFDYFTALPTKCRPGHWKAADWTSVSHYCFNSISAQTVRSITAWHTLRALRLTWCVLSHWHCA